MRHRHRWTRWTAMASGNRYRACRDWACGDVEAVAPDNAKESGDATSHQ